MNDFKKIVKPLKTDILPIQILHAVMADQSMDAKKSYLKRACQKGDLVRVRNGLYLLGEEYRARPYNPFEIANYIREPSYVSLESALSYYGLIPEAVYTTTSVTTNPNLEQETPVGHFSYSHLRSNYFNFGFYRAKEGEYRFLIATPLKALVDYIVLKKKFYTAVEDIEADLRFDFEEFKTYKTYVSEEKIDEMLLLYKTHRIQVILKEIKKKL
ncbi:MAG: type IV toxin-antitoxin system AbiEi family antitoxin domain-containing protein [Bacteriovoracaceae bacterium]|jgi:predicted transcriptional regulator of viral defense system